MPDSVKKALRKAGKAVVMRHLGGVQKVRLLFGFLRHKRRAARLDLSEFRARGLVNQPFIDQQLEYLAMFAALADILGSEKTIAIMKEVMDESATEALLLCLPKPENVRQFEDPFAVFRDYVRAMPPAACTAGCHEITVTEDTDEAIQFDVSWCVWLELARAMDIQEACIPNCYSDDLAFPDYFSRFGVRYGRTQTLAKGGCKCDFRFERM